MHLFEFPIGDEETHDLVEEKVSELTDRLKGDEPKAELMRRRNALVRWLQERANDVKSFGQVQVIRKEFRNNRHMREFLK